MSHRWNPKGKQNPAWKGGVITNKKWFYKKYIVEGLSLRQVAKEANRSLRTAARWAEKHNIPLRSHKEACPGKHGKSNPNWKGGSVCQKCGKQNSVTAKKCMTCYHNSRLGPNNPNWKGMKDIKSNVRSFLKKNWVPKIFIRDNFECKRCFDNKGGNLHAHHITRLSIIIDQLLEGMPLENEVSRLYAYEFLINHPSILDVHNGITLCNICHNKLHKGPFRDIYPLYLLE